MNFNEKNGYPVHNGVFGYKESIAINNRVDKVMVWVYFKPIEVLRNENGFPTGYKILKILDVVEYLNTERADLCKEHVYTNLDVPNDVKFVMGG